MPKRPDSVSPRPCVVYILRRSNWRADYVLNAALEERLRRPGVRIEWEPIAAAPDGMWDGWLQRNQRLPWPLARVGLMSFKLWYGLAHPRYLAFVSGCHSLLIRKIAMHQRVRHLARDADVVVIGRSAGGVLASAVADRLPVSHVICLGYPFRNPNNGDEPYRYRHLRSLRTPMLILQGTHDVYGGFGVERRYELSSQIELRYVATDHEFSVGPVEIDAVVGMIEESLGWTHPAELVAS